MDLPKGKITMYCIGRTIVLISIVSAALIGCERKRDNSLDQLRLEERENQKKVYEEKLDQTEYEKNLLNETLQNTINDLNAKQTELEAQGIKSQELEDQIAGLQGQLKKLEEGGTFTDEEKKKLEDQISAIKSQTLSLAETAKAAYQSEKETVATSLMLTESAKAGLTSLASELEKASFEDISNTAATIDGNSLFSAEEKEQVKTVRTAISDSETKLKTSHQNKIKKIGKYMALRNWKKKIISNAKNPYYVAPEIENSWEQPMLDGKAKLEADKKLNEKMDKAFEASVQEAKESLAAYKVAKAKLKPELQSIIKLKQEKIDKDISAFKQKIGVLDQKLVEIEKTITEFKK